MMTKKELSQKVKILISKDKLKKAIQLLSEYIVDNEELDHLLLQQGRYNRIKQQAANGTVSNNELNNEINILGKHILAFIREGDWEVKPNEEAHTRPNIDDFQTDLAMSLTRIAVGRLLLQYAEEERDVSMRTIMKNTQLKSRKLVNDFIKELEAYELINKKKQEVVVWSLNRAGRKRLAKVLK